MSESFTKLSNSLPMSSVWGEEYATRLVWVTLLAEADQHGEILASVPGLARLANVTLPEAEEALRVLSGPDPYSRTPDNEGRRVAAIDGGWVLLNYDRYRKLASAEDRKEKDRKRKARVRSSPHVSAPCPGLSAGVRTGSAVSIQAEEEAEGEAEVNPPQSVSQTNGELYPPRVAGLPLGSLTEDGGKSLGGQA